MYERSDQLFMRLQMVESLLPSELQHPEVLKLIQMALAEDLSASAELGSYPAEGDITSRATIPAGERLTGYFRTKAVGVVVGLPVARGVFQLVDPAISFRTSVKDGDIAEKGQIITQVEGDVRGLL
ncbi:MAG TPA: hypothetical protein VLD65_14020, partial [Anaerolineales bacterium]|nr:hypothetical protein [Anaerolineales bacterium]